MPRKQTSEYVVKGYFGGMASLIGVNDSDLALRIVCKVNSVKQAQERFLKKYEPVLSGYWHFEITDTSGKQLIQFVRYNDGTIELFNDDIPF